MMTYEEFRDRFHIRLTAQQTEAVRAVEGPVLLLAVPGSGKTTVLVTRLGYMIHCAGIPSENILTLTYTVAATRDMAARFAERFGEEIGRRMEFRTINGVCAKIIDYYSQSVGKSPFSLVTDEKRIAGMLSAIYQRVEGGYATEGDLKGIRTLITYIKNSMLDETEIKKLEQESDWRIAEIYRLYREELRARGLMDYDDQMLYAGNILARSPETLAYFRKRYPYICVDEAQDTSRIQHAIIRRLAGGRDNLFLVGDEDQSIYGFRAAYPQALLSFEQDHPGARVLLMEENFRSCAQIVEAADRFIQKNTLRHEKHMKAARAAGEEIEQIPLNDRKAQYDYLVRMAERCQVQTAVLYRNHENVLPLVDQLERKGIPYRLRNAEMTFFTHRVVTDIRNIIAFAMNPRDTAVFLQIYYKIATYIKKQDALRICEISEREDRDIMEIALRGGQLPDRTVQSCRLIRMHLKCLLTERADRAIARIVYNMGYGDYLERMEIGDSKVFILKMIGQGENSPGRFVERLDELRAIMEGRMKGGQEERREERREERQEEASVVYRNGTQDIQPVILSTIHSSKGLEYDNVYLLDVIDGIFPESVPANAKFMDEKEREIYEEERRLFYVGVTRAKDRLSVFRLDQKSSLCEELVGRKKKAVQKMRRTLAQERGNAAVERPFDREAYENYAAQIGEGLIIRHRKFGEGVVEEVQGELVVIRFGEMQKTLGIRVLYEKDLLIL